MNEPAQRQKEFPTGYTDLPRNMFVWLSEDSKEDTLVQGVEGGREKTLITTEERVYSTNHYCSVDLHLFPERCRCLTKV